jgi:stage II sporulation protein R
MKKIISMTVAILAFLIVLSLLPTGAEGRIYKDTIRLRVIANSDDAEDQRVKLLVRDAILCYVEENYAHIEEKEAALAAVDRDRTELEAVAREALAQEGCSYDVSVWVGEEAYDRRDYGTFALPSGTYMSLQIRLGEAAGQNWWCVLFPPLCLGGAIKEERTEDSVPVGLTGDQYELITSGGKASGRYRVKFRLLELLSEWFGGSGY